MTGFGNPQERQGWHDGVPPLIFVGFRLFQKFISEIERIALCCPAVAKRSVKTTGGFPADIQPTLERVASRCGTVIEAVCGAEPRAKDVAERFGVHAKLGWQLWNVAYASPMSVLRYLPNEKGLEVWREAASARGVSGKMLDQLGEAIEKVRELTERHGGDRESFEMLLDARTEEADAEHELRWRRQAFAGNSFMFGVRARCALATLMLYPSPKKAGYFSLVRLHGLLDLVRMRAEVRWPVATMVIEPSDGKHTMPKREPLEKGHAGSAIVPVWEKYCSDPLPEVVRRIDGAALRDELLPGTVGETGRATLMTAEIVHEIAPAHGERAGEIAHFGSGVRMPVEMFFADHIVHRSIFPGVKRELRVYSELISSTARDDFDRMQVSEQLQHLGRGMGRIRMNEVPRYDEMLTDAFERIGMDPDEFDVYRVRMRYPPVPSSVMVRHALPPPPK